MQVEMKGTGELQHVSQTVATILIAAGLATEVPANAPDDKAKPNIRFVPQPGSIVDDYEFPPVMFAQCSTCGHKCWTESRKGTAYQAEIRHCGIVDRCDPQAAAEYQAMFAKWQARSRKTKPVLVSPHTERHVHAFGMKTQSELKTDAQLLLVAKK